MGSSYLQTGKGQLRHDGETAQPVSWYSLWFSSVYGMGFPGMGQQQVESQIRGGAQEAGEGHPTFCGGHKAIFCCVCLAMARSRFLIIILVGKFKRKIIWLLGVGADMPKIL